MIIVMKNRALNIINKTGKRLIDIIAGIVGTIMLIPITLIIAIINLFEKDNRLKKINKTTYKLKEVA